MQPSCAGRRRQGVGITVIGILLTTLAIGGAQAKGGGARGGGAENVGGAGSGLSCTGGGEFGSAGVNRSGTRLTVAVAMTNDSLGADWEFVVTDNGVVAGTSSLAYPGLTWAATQTVNLAKGQHIIDIALTSDAGEVCTGSTSVKV